MNAISKISVIMPVYNVEEFLEEAIESVLNQSFQELELILVNDGSTDNSSTICEKYVEEDKRIKYIEQKNSGVSIARNKGLSLAEGEYIFFMDSDDTIDSDFLKTSYETAKKEDSDIVVIGEYYCKRRIPNPAALPTCAQLLRHEFLKQYPDIRFPENIQPCEDGLFSHQLLALTDKTSGNPVGIYVYREHERQNHLVINSNTAKVLEQIPLWFRVLEQFYTRYNLYQTKALHLARFVEHEPFEFRYLSMPFNPEQKKQLHKIIVDFMDKNVFPYLSSQEFDFLTTSFKIFVKTKDNKIFDSYLLRKKRKRKILVFLISCIPLRKVRRKLRQQFSDDQ